jgi:hypothetical protein
MSSGVDRAAAAALLLLSLAAGCASSDAPSARPKPTAASPGASAASADGDVARRLVHLKAEMAITPHFCSLEDRRCRAQQSLVIEKAVAALLARCAGKAGRSLDRCLESEAAHVVAPSPTP